MITLSFVYNPLEHHIFNILGSGQRCCKFADDIFKCIFLTENVWISTKYSLTNVSRGPINNIPAFVQIMTCCQPGYKPLSETMLMSLLTDICPTRPQWAKYIFRVSAIVYDSHRNIDNYTTDTNKTKTELPGGKYNIFNYSPSALSVSHVTRSNLMIEFVYGYPISDCVTVTLQNVWMSQQ